VKDSTNSDGLWQQMSLLTQGLRQNQANKQVFSIASRADLVQFAFDSSIPIA